MTERQQDQRYIEQLRAECLRRANAATRDTRTYTSSALSVTVQNTTVTKSAPKHRPYTPIARRHCPPEPSRQAIRTLPTNSAAWRKLRAAVLAIEPLCRECAKHRRVRAANHVDHINGDASNNDMPNLQPLCAPCHSRKTATEDGGWGNTAKR